MLDATIGLNRTDEEEAERPAQPSSELVVRSDKEVQFRINVNDLALLRALGIDPTRKVRGARRIEPLTQPSEDLK